MSINEGRFFDRDAFLTLRRAGEAFRTSLVAGPDGLPRSAAWPLHRSSLSTPKRWIA